MVTMSAGEGDVKKKAEGSSGTKRKTKQPVKFKKAPQAPRRFKSAYMFFSTAKHPEIRAKLKKEGVVSEKTTKIAKMVSQEWKSLSSEEREKWEEMAREDKARFEMEKTLYTGPWKVPAKKRSQKDPDAPKRPMSAFLSFSNNKRAETRRENPHCSNAEISRILARLWKEASEEERKEHIDREYKLRQEYKVAIAAWKKNAETELQAQRQEREEVARKAAASRDSVPQGAPGMPNAAGYEDQGNPNYYRSDGGRGDYYSQGGHGPNPPYPQHEGAPSSYNDYQGGPPSYAGGYSSYNYPPQYGYGGGYEGGSGTSSYYGNSPYGGGYGYYPPQQYNYPPQYEGGAPQDREAEQNQGTPMEGAARPSGPPPSQMYGEYQS